MGEFFPQMCFFCHETSSLLSVNTEDARQRRLIVSLMMRGILGRLHAARNESGERREPKGTSLLYRQADACRSAVVARMTIPLGHGLGPMPW